MSLNCYYNITNRLLIKKPISVKEKSYQDFVKVGKVFETEIGQQLTIVRGLLKNIRYKLGKKLPKTNKNSFKTLIKIKFNFIL